MKNEIQIREVPKLGIDLNLILIQLHEIFVGFLVSFFTESFSVCPFSRKKRRHFGKCRQMFEKIILSCRFLKEEMPDYYSDSRLFLFFYDYRNRRNSTKIHGLVLQA